MATKPKGSSSTPVGNEKKKVPSSSSLPTPTKRITKPSTAIKSNSTTPSEKNIPSYLKPTTSFRQTKTETPIKPPPIRRRSFDKPFSSSNLTTKTTQPSPSRLQKALVSPGPKERSSLNIRSPVVPVKSISPLKPISEKTPSDAKTKQVWKKAAKKITAPNSNIATSNTTKKVSNDHAASVSPVKIKSVTTDKDSSNVEAEDVKEVEEVQEVTNLEDEVIKVENEEHASHENISSDVNSEIVHEHEHDNQVLEDSGTPQNQVDDEKVISTVSGTPQNQVDDEKVISTISGTPQNQVDDEKVISTVSGTPQNQVDDEKDISTVSEEAEKESREEKHEVEHEEKENNNGNQSEEVDHSEVEREKVVNENEENESGIVPEDEKNETNEEHRREEKEVVEGGVSEKVEEEAKVEVAKPKQQQAGGGNGKKESQVSNDMIEETASKLLGRKNKVLALAGAFQTVIDHQTK